MEIPYTVKPREDTGLWNAKLGIWLFLASEVMLFGGLFSSYIFLRLGAGADPMYHWPVQELKILPGFLNTLILIGSSVTVVMAWVSLKLRKYGAYQIYMAITLVCALLFMVIKGIEYKGKFAHSSVRLTDGTVVDGHIHKNVVHFTDITEVDVPTEEPSLKFLDKYHYEDKHHGHGHDDAHGDAAHPEGAAGHGGAKEKGDHHADDHGSHDSGKLEFLTAEGEPIKSLKKHIREFQLLPKEERPSTIKLKLSQPQELGVKPSMVVAYNDKSMTLRDGTVIYGDLADDSLHINVDAADLRNVKKAEESLAWSHLSPAHKSKFMEHADEQIAHFTEKYPKYDPLSQPESIKKAFFQKFGKDEHQEVAIPRDQVKFYSSHTPKWNTYYAIYFTMTGLHGLHVIGGAIVLWYMGFRCRWLYDKDPEHLANRVEVAGLFWHFVDLVWIFLFPIMYLL